MSVERQERLEDLFHRAAEVPPEDLDSFLNRESRDGADDALAREVRELLACDSRVPAGFLPDGDGAAEVGTRIGAYEVVERIGEGGMGTVYRAEQSSPVRRTVALKIVKLGMNTAEVVTRFEAERQALALMDHRSIARVLDAGATEDGRPFFAMELVSGAPITEFCTAHALDLEARLSLFQEVCRAVEHAHQKGIVHRDLKPSNVLVPVRQNPGGYPLPPSSTARTSERREKRSLRRFGLGDSSSMDLA